MLESVKQLGKLSSSSSAPLLYFKFFLICLGLVSRNLEFWGFNPFMSFGSMSPQIPLGCHFSQECWSFVRLWQILSYSGNTARKKILFHSFSFQNSSNNSSYMPLFYLSFFYQVWLCWGHFETQEFSFSDRDTSKLKHTTVNHHSQLYKSCWVKSLLKCHYGFQHH